MKEKVAEEKSCIENCLCANAYHSCYDNLIREERKNVEKENIKTRENLKYQVTP